MGEKHSRSSFQGLVGVEILFGCCCLDIVFEVHDFLEDESSVYHSVGKASKYRANSRPNHINHNHIFCPPKKIEVDRPVEYIKQGIQDHANKGVCIFCCFIGKTGSSKPVC